MTDREGRLTTEEKASLLEQLNSKTRNVNCEVCGENNWMVADHLVTNVRFGAGSVRMGGAVYPQVALVCSNCSFVRYHMAIPLGITGEAEEVEPEEQVDD